MIRNLYEVLSKTVNPVSRKEPVPSDVQTYSAEELVDKDQLGRDALGEYGGMTLREKRTVKTINPKNLKGWGGKNLVEVFSHAKPWQKKLVATYKKSEPTTPGNIIIVDGNMVVDGHHRAMAAILADRTIQCIDLNESLNEAAKSASKEKPKAKPVPREEPILAIKLVDGKKTRDTIAVDFIGGGHYYAYPDLIPKGEVWIEQDLAPDEQVDILVHELVEFALMSRGGMTYTPAHNLANKLEKVFRGFEGRWKTKQAPEGDKKVEEGLIAESYNNALQPFIRYLNAGIDPHDFGHLLNDFFEDEGIESPEGFDEDEPFEFPSSKEFEQYRKPFISWVEDKLSTNPGLSDALAPTYLFMNGATLIPRQTWLIHFSDDADDIARNGFEYGAEDFTALGLTTHLSEKRRKSKPGWNFAFTADDRSVRIGSKKYGKSAVLFQSAGVEAFHDGDNESQVVFWGPNVKERFYLHNEGGDWRVQDPRTDKVLFTSENIFDTIKWVQANHGQYRKVITNDQKATPIQPTPKADREKLLAKTPERTPQPFESEGEPVATAPAPATPAPPKIMPGTKAQVYDAANLLQRDNIPVKGALHFVATADDEVVGAIFGSSRKGANGYYIVRFDLAVDRSYRRQGIARALIAKMMEKITAFSEKNKAKVIVRVDVAHTAIESILHSYRFNYDGKFYEMTITPSEKVAETETPKGTCPKCGLAKHSAIPHLCSKGRSKWGAKGGKFTTPERPAYKTKPVTESGNLESVKPMSLEKAKKIASKLKDFAMPGSRWWFEYHCNEAHDSGDTPAWYRSHEIVTVIAPMNYDEGYDGTDFDERGRDGMPLVYRARWSDGFEWDVWEDELCKSPKGFCRPDPPVDPTGKTMKPKDAKKFPNVKVFGQVKESEGEEDLLTIVQNTASNTHPDDHLPADYTWARNKAFSTETLTHMMPGGLAGWKSWLQDECKQMPHQWDKLAKTDEIQDPVIISPGHIWDGWHRIAAAIVNGHKTIPAIVGKLHAH